MKRDDLWYIIQDAKVKKIIIAGIGSESRELLHQLKLIDVEIAYFVDIESSQKLICGKEVKSVYDLLYEPADSFKVILTQESKNIVQNLQELGLKFFRDYNFALDYSPNEWREYYADALLGYNISFSGNEFTGFKIFGDINAKNRIVILGGSTADISWYVYKPIAEFLYDIFRAEQKDVVIFCGGVVAYKASQELLKLIRDVLPLHPNMVIDYSGINDATLWEAENPFYHPYFHEINRVMEEAISHSKMKVPMTKFSFYPIKSVTGGIENKDESAYLFYKKMIRLMNAICGAEGIKFISFFQPAMPYKLYANGYSVFEQELYVNRRLMDTDREKLLKAFYEEKMKDEQFEKYRVDLSHLFDDVGDVYIDLLHVNDKGNKMIAQKIYDTIADDIK